jgi:uncharacterized RDD family membrane protein YckC
MGTLGYWFYGDKVINFHADNKTITAVFSKKVEFCAK